MEEEEDPGNTNNTSSKDLATATPSNTSERRRFVPRAPRKTRSLEEKRK